MSKILASAAYQRDGMLIITFDEADIDVKGGKVRRTNGLDGMLQ